MKKTYWIVILLAIFTGGYSVIEMIVKSDIDVLLCVVVFTSILTILASRDLVKQEEKDALALHLDTVSIDEDKVVDNFEWCLNTRPNLLFGIRDSKDLNKEEKLKLLTILDRVKLDDLELILSK